MAGMFAIETAIANLERALAKQCDEKDKVSVQARLRDLRALTDNIRQAIADGKLEGMSDRLDKLLRECDNEQMRLKSGSRGFKDVSRRQSSRPRQLEENGELLAKEKIFDYLKQALEILWRVHDYENKNEALQLALATKKIQNLKEEAPSHVWPIPMYAGISVKSAKSQIRQIENLLPNSHFLVIEDLLKSLEIKVVDSDIHFMKKAAYDCEPSESWNLLSKTTVARHKLYCVSKLLEALGKEKFWNTLESSVGQELLLPTDIRALENTIKSIVNLVDARGIGYTTIFHMLTDLGLAVKPDLHLNRSYDLLFFGRFSEEGTQPSFSKACEIVSRCVDVSRSQEFKEIIMSLSPNTALAIGSNGTDAEIRAWTRLFDKLVMDLSFVGYDTDKSFTAINNLAVQQGII